MRRYFKALICVAAVAVDLAFVGSAWAQAQGCLQQGRAKSADGEVWVSVDTSRTALHEPQRAFWKTPDRRGPNILLFANYRVAGDGHAELRTLRLDVGGDFTGAAQFTSGDLKVVVGNSSWRLASPNAAFQPIAQGLFTIADLDSVQDNQNVVAREVLTAVSNGETIRAAIETPAGEILYETQLKAPSAEVLRTLYDQAMANAAQATRGSADCLLRVPPPPPIAIQIKPVDGGFQPILQVDDGEIFLAADASARTGPYWSAKLLKVYTPSKLISGLQKARTEINAAIDCKDFRFKILNANIFDQNDQRKYYIRPTDFYSLVSADQALAISKKLCSADSSDGLLPDRRAAENFAYAHMP